MIRSSIFILCSIVASLSSGEENRSGDPPYPYKRQQDVSLKPYSYQYGIKDDYSGVNIRAEESSDAKIVKGSYQVALPDSRIQKVSYTVDGDSGFVANVQYEGVAIYPNPVPFHNSTPIKNTHHNS